MDAHTHRVSASPHLYVLNQSELAQGHSPSESFCAGIHPWWVSKGSREHVERLAQASQCLAIGETGLDRLYPLWEEQLASFQWHWDLAERMHKPLVVHVVRSSSDVLQLLKRRKPKTPWVWHDFTGPLEALPKLLKLHPQLYFSCGLRAVRRRNFPELWAAIPKHLRLLETDDADVSIQEIYQLAGVSYADLKDNFQTLLPTRHW